MKSLTWRVKVVDVGLVWPNHYKSKCLIFSKPFAWCLNSFFLSQQIKFSSYVLKTLKILQFAIHLPLAQLLGTQHMIDLTTSKICLFFLSTISFCWGVLEQELWWTIPFLLRYSPKIWLKYFLPISICRIWMLVEYWVLIMLWKFLKICLASNLSFNKYSQHTHLWSSIKEINQDLK